MQYEEYSNCISMAGKWGHRSGFGMPIATQAWHRISKDYGTLDLQNKTEETFLK